MDQLGLKFAEVPISCYYTVLVVWNGLDWIGLKLVETQGGGGSVGHDFNNSVFWFPISVRTAADLFIPLIFFSPRS